VGIAHKLAMALQLLLWAMPTLLGGYLRCYVLSVSENREELEKEIKTIDDLINRANVIIQNEEEIKLKEFKKALSELSQKYPDKSDKKILIFTESKDTLTYLEDNIKRWGYDVNTIHGGMNLQERIKAEGVFKNETQVMVATEAAGEGINLQFCHLMINYDIPWNPNRLEQRMGRIHRYGQQKEVFVFNLVAEDTREGKVLKALFDKLEEIKRELGSDKVFDVISEILYGKSLSQILMEAAASARDIDEILKDIDFEVDEEYIAQVKENLGESLATHYIDYTRIKEMFQKAREFRLIPEYIESFFKKAFLKADGKLRERKDEFLTIESIPYEIRRIAEQDDFKRRYCELLKRYAKVTFDKEIAFKNPDAEFVSFGHPLFEAMMIWIESNFLDSLLGGATFIDPDGRLDGYILFYEGEIKDGTGNTAGKRLFGFYTNENEIKPIPPSIIWDLEENTGGAEIHGETVILPVIPIDSLKKHVSTNVILKLEEYKSEILKERERQTEIKQKYGVSSLNHLIVKLDGELILLYDRKEKGESVDLVIRNKEERKEEYERTLAELKNLIQKEKSLTMSMPRFVGIIRVKVANIVDKDMQSDAKIERIGMKKATDYEIKNGREPEDVSEQNLGFDIRSKDKGGNIRYIEVKARAETGSVSLTQDEWFKAIDSKMNIIFMLLWMPLIIQGYISSRIQRRD